MDEYRIPAFHTPTPSAEVEARTAAFQRKLSQLGLDGALLLYPVDLFYFTGSMQAGHLWIPARGPALYLVRRDFDRARAESPLEQIRPLSSLKDLPGLLTS